ELRDSNGTVIANLQTSTSGQTPKLPAHLAATRSRLLTTGAASGSGTFRVLVAPSQERANETVVVAVPMTDVTTSLHRLVLIEVTGGAALLLVLSFGSWFVLRRGLRPLEEMAGTARTITAGDEVDLSQRVSPSGGA